MDELAEKINDLYKLYNEIKLEIQFSDKYFYEQWKAGGFLIDDSIFSSYPSLGDFEPEFEDEEEDEDQEIAD